MNYLFDNTTASPIDGGVDATSISSFPNGDISELPEGLAMALAQDTAALRRFTNLTVSVQDDVIRRARKVSTRDEMRRLIETF